MKASLLFLVSLTSALSVVADDLLPYKSYCAQSNDIQPRACFHLSTDGDTMKGTSAIFKIVQDTADENNYAVLPQTAFQTNTWQGTVTHNKNDANCVDVNLEVNFGLQPQPKQHYVTCRDDGMVINIW
ncbi:uncharacterized protein UTRI_04993 [Ustilago trichophora]|uniref:Mig1 protein n=1 Tax=Ustilago trichophora TaxID=86804 RepID=A0A5C3ECD4_9BASI|nr:uncharacterized protein UTRI_04993 [Ustilago trichophora]